MLIHEHCDLLHTSLVYGDVSQNHDLDTGAMQEPRVLVAVGFSGDFGTEVSGSLRWSEPTLWCAAGAGGACDGHAATETDNAHRAVH